MQHFAYLRACAEGLPIVDSAKAYLGLDDGRKALSVHRSVVNALRALARRLGDRRWRYIGLMTPGHTVLSVAFPPTLDEWRATQGLEEWSEAEVLEMYLSAMPPAAETADRRQRRNARIRVQQLTLLKLLEPIAATNVQPDDPVDSWLPDYAARLAHADIHNMGELARAVASGRTWWSGIQGVGAIKARQVASQMLFLNADALAAAELGGLVTARLPALSSISARVDLDGSVGNNRHAQAPRINADDDHQAIESWLRARTGRSPLTAASYRREAERFLLWCVLERSKPLSSANVDDCVAYMNFIQNIPQKWISREKAPRHSSGWTPFRGQLSAKSRRHSITLLHNLFEWLARQRYLDSNPWTSVDRSLVEGDELVDSPTSRALTAEGYAALIEIAIGQGQLGAGPRNRFLLEFLRYTGLRISELINATVGSLREDGDGWTIEVVGKGRRRRWVTLVSPAVQALERYFASRALPWPPLDDASELPLVAAVTDGRSAVSYETLYSTFKDFVAKAADALSSNPHQHNQLMRASLHWLRHTFATRAAEAGVPEDVLMAEMGASLTGNDRAVLH